MSQASQAHLQHIETNPEVKSYIYQLIAEFEPFVTPETVVAVVAKDPKKLAKKLREQGDEMEPSKLARMHRISIILKDNETQIQAEAVSENIYDAIKLAKEKLVAHLAAIQDVIQTNAERTAQINSALNSHLLH
ncbi:MAG: HPF/RaiA family ribosome-associated protein [Bdellovibrionota bacterium]